MYVSPETEIVYKDIQEYNNSNEFETNIVAIKLQAGVRTPQNKDEEKMLEEIRMLEAQGKIVEIPYGTF